MNIQSRIDQAVRHHAPVSELRDILKDEKHDRLRFETELSHHQAMDMQSLMSATKSMQDRASKDADGLYTVRNDLDDLLLTIRQLETLVKAVAP
jgi:UDP-glucose 6-dehydrogenase